MPTSAMKARFQIAECSSLYRQKKDGMILEHYLYDDKTNRKKDRCDGTDCTAIAIYSPNSLILCSSFNEQTSSCPFFSATI